jgi:hypothetical protein
VGEIVEQLVPALEEKDQVLGPDRVGNPGLVADPLGGEDVVEPVQIDPGLGGSLVQKPPSPLPKAPLLISSYFAISCDPSEDVFRLKKV